MNSWNTNNMQVGQANFSPYTQPSFNPYQFSNNRLPVYSAAPIHGRDAAWQFPMGPNSEIYLPDADQDIIWWIRTDNMGNKSVQAFDVKVHEEPKPVDTNDLAARLAAVEEWINGKSNKSNAKRSGGNTAANVSTDQ